MNCQLRFERRGGEGDEKDETDNDDAARRTTHRELDRTVQRGACAVAMPARDATQRSDEVMTQRSQELEEGEGEVVLAL